jgi:hypothetical protein
MWHGNIHRALQLIDETADLLGSCQPGDTRDKTVRFVHELDTYLTNKAQYSRPCPRRQGSTVSG